MVTLYTIRMCKHPTRPSIFDWNSWLHNNLRLKFIKTLSPNTICTWWYIKRYNFHSQIFGVKYDLHRTVKPSFPIQVNTYHFYIWTCPWCNGNRRRKWTRPYEFKSWTRLMAFHIALIPLGKVWIQLFSLPLWVNSRAE